MRNILFSALLLLPVSGFAASFDNPTVTVAGVTHHLIDMNEKTGAVYDSGDGFCKLKGYTAFTQIGATLSNPGPVAILNINGAVVSTFPNNADGSYWIISSVSCE